MPEQNQNEETRLSWWAKNLADIQKIAMALIFISGLGYATIDWLGTHFITKADASGYALKSNVKSIDHTLAKTQIMVLENELYIARKDGIQQEDKEYLRTLHKRVYELKIKIKIYDAKEKDYKAPKYLQE